MFERGKLSRVTFRYEIFSGDLEVAFLKSPGLVELDASPGDMSIYWAWADLGKWKAKLKSAHRILNRCSI